jgi:predicted metal-dependent enzyme (double-stranded beta helix superfamily)
MELSELESNIDRLLGDKYKVIDRPMLSQLEALIGEAVRSKAWFPTKFSVPSGHKLFSQYLLSQSRHDLWHLIICVWMPGMVTPIHDHGSWGVIGVMEGRETTATYKRGDSTCRSLVPTTEFVCNEGDTTSFLPGDDIHQVQNEGPTKAVSLHLYGVDLGRVGRHEYDLQSDKKIHRVIPYDNPP